MRNISKFLWFAVFLTVAVLGSGLAWRPQEQTREDRTAPIVKSQDASLAKAIPDWVKDVRHLRSIGDAETARQILRQNSSAEVYAGDSGPLTPADRPLMFEESAGKSPDGVLQWQDPDIPIFNFANYEDRPDLAVRLDTSTPDIYAIAERHQENDPYYDDLVLRASADNGRTWGTTKTISHTTNDYRWPRMTQIGSGYLGVVFEDHLNPNLYADIMKVNTANFDDCIIWLLDNDGARNEFRPEIASDIADYPAAPYTYAAYVSTAGKDVRIFLRRSEDGEHTWTSRIEIAHLPDWSSYTSVSLAINGDMLYCAYTSGDDSSAQSHNIEVKTSWDYGNTWSAAATIADTANVERSPRIAAADADHAVCVYQNCTQNATYYAYTQNGGISWVTDIWLADNNAWENWPEVKATIPAGFFYVAYHKNTPDEVYIKRAPYADPNGSSWTSLGNVKANLNVLAENRNSALLAKVHPNGGFSAAVAWAEKVAGSAANYDVRFDAEWLPQYTLNLTKSGAGGGEVRVDGKLIGAGQRKLFQRDRLSSRPSRRRGGFV